MLWILYFRTLFLSSPVFQEKQIFSGKGTFFRAGFRRGRWWTEKGEQRKVFIDRPDIIQMVRNPVDPENWNLKRGNPLRFRNLIEINDSPEGEDGSFLEFLTPDPFRMGAPLHPPEILRISYSSFRAVPSTYSRVSRLISGSALVTRETVACELPAARATSRPLIRFILSPTLLSPCGEHDLEWGDFYLF